MAIVINVHFSFIITINVVCMYHSHNITILITLAHECVCKDFVSASGYGNCKKTSPSIGKVTCYVKQPSSCGDLTNSKTDPGEQYSAKACEIGIWYSNNIIVANFVFWNNLYNYLLKCYLIYHFQSRMKINEGGAVLKFQFRIPQHRPNNYSTIVNPEFNHNRRMSK